MKQKHWILIFVALFAVCLAVWLLPRGGGQTALVYQDGTLLYTLDLRQNRTLTVSGPAGENIITVADGKVFVFNRFTQRFIAGKFVFLVFLSNFTA